MRLHDYQRLAVDHLHRNPRAGLFLDMGLGKTAVALSALTPDHLPALVVAPKRVAENVWPEEGASWRPDLRMVVAKGSPKDRARELGRVSDVAVIGRDNMADVLDHPGRFRTVVLDESSGFKNRSSLRWRTARKLARRAGGPDCLWELTGSPSPNGLMDLWAPTYLLDAGARLGSTLTAFRGRYFTPGPRLPNGVVTRWLPRDEAEESILGKLEDICLAMETDGRIELPPSVLNVMDVPLPPAVRAQYRTMKKKFVLDLSALGGSCHSASTAAVLTNKLSQMSAGFLYHEDAGVGTDGRRPFDVLHREKVRAVQEIVDGTGSPVLVFYHFQAEAQLLREAMPEKVYTMDEPDVQARWNAGKIPVLLAHPASAGHGLNLQRGPGHTAVWTTLPWSLEEWAQANKRLLRQGQGQTVVTHLLMAPRTVDQTVLSVLEGKATVQDALLAHLESVL